MSVAGTVLGWLLLLFELVLIARLVVDWVAVLAGSDGGWQRQARRVTHTLTEPVLAPVRRVLRPVQIGSVAIDLALPVVFILVVVLRAIVVRW
ncbi:YggT family protein [Pseudonocardia hispaniensis]|uniref:YggT family protein n=1 Tax=Pseudonocardia hispaniensis TaxID=904933 RepID=A0ABW1IWW5_9PSEU